MFGDFKVSLITQSDVFRKITDQSTCICTSQIVTEILIVVCRVMSVQYSDTLGIFLFFSGSWNKRRIAQIFGRYSTAVAKSMGKIIYNSFDYIISGNSDSQKVYQDEVFYYEDILHFFLEWSVSPHINLQTDTLTEKTLPLRLMLCNPILISPILLHSYSNKNNSP